ncbi:MAG: hypothetical protein AAGG08_21775, partial [Actinomycetota bacterium]
MTPEQLRECAERARDARVALEPEREMVVGQESTVVVTAFVGEPPAPRQPDTSSTVSETTIVDAPLTCLVEATLDGGEDFTVSPDLDSPQSGTFLRSNSIDWQWDVTPRRAGAFDLVVRLQPILQSGNARIEETAVPFEQTIEVSATPRSVIEVANDSAESFISHPLVRGAGTIAAFVGVLGGVWHWILKRPWP